MKRPPNKVVFLLYFSQLFLIILTVAQEKLQDGSDAATEGASDLDPLWKAYSECKSELGEAVLTCDPGKALQPYGVQKSVSPYPKDCDVNEIDFSLFGSTIFYGVCSPRFLAIAHRSTAVFDTRSFQSLPESWRHS